MCIRDSLHHILGAPDLFHFPGIVYKPHNGARAAALRAVQNIIVAVPARASVAVRVDKQIHPVRTGRLRDLIRAFSIEIHVFFCFGNLAHREIIPPGFVRIMKLPYVRLGIAVRDVYKRQVLLPAECRRAGAAI